LNCETDFVSRGGDFRQLSRAVAKALASTSLGDDIAISIDASAGLKSKSEPLQTFLDVPVQLGSPATVHDTMKALTGKVRENMVLRRAAVGSLGNSKKGAIGTYAYSSPMDKEFPECGRIAALVAIQASKDSANVPEDKYRDAASKVAKHVVAMNPANEAELLSQDLMGAAEPTPVQKYLDAHGATLSWFVRYQVGQQ
jgi:translation elongation factor EF-Ts